MFDYYIISKIKEVRRIKKKTVEKVSLHGCDEIQPILETY